MARRLRWVARAADDLEAITEYIAEDSAPAARRTARRLVSAALSLTHLSERGRIVPELRPLELREILVGAYRLIYRVEPEATVIVAVIHGARDLESLWRRERRDRPE
jgi:toxin ParE1/3/4